jgi:hypothetical protein
VLRFNSYRSVIGLWTAGLPAPARAVHLQVLAAAQLTHELVKGTLAVDQSACPQIPSIDMEQIEA